MSNYILQTRGLGFLDLLRYPDLSIEENKATFILGESGCGKSTLLRLFNATLLPSAGEIFYRGENIRQLEVCLLYTSGLSARSLVSAPPEKVPLASAARL